MKIKILKSASKDLEEGFYFYEFQHKGLGTYFLEALTSDIESLQLYAGIHSIHFKKYHRLLSQRFPFAVYYQCIKNEIRIYAVVDCRRKPAWIRNKLT
ncbi:type II toxin-antitoxin system RelE/ParE family toxin [Desulfobacula sp.]|uniref:type II toxin-antitoxin system RelE/ParE family toxin n=1 Tax=Desulfobacula sp. TaxID=2593537 RepID=UPI0027148C09|nr:type II toxin-antitoxin system RelE/ParE family toxin [Desulfobacula sp.]